VKRLIIIAVLIIGSVSAAAHPAADPNVSVAQKSALLKHGQFIWAAPPNATGTVSLVINLTTQRALLFRDHVLIAASTISTGRKGRETPLGTFPILEKAVMHRSRTYDDAPMPYMQRLTAKGVAMHAGNLPGYPASHGCIRLPYGFAKLLYGVTELGTLVTITDEEQERLAADYKRATEDAARQTAALVEEANRRFADFAKAKSDHEEALDRYRAALTNKESLVPQR